MRRALIALAAAGALLPSAALAADRAGEVRRMADDLDDPLLQAEIAASAAAVTDAVLSMPAAPLARAIAEVEGADPDYVDPDLRVGDLVDPSAADRAYEFADRLPRTMAALAGVAAALEDTLPELRERIEAVRERPSRY